MRKELRLGFACLSFLLIGCSQDLTEEATALAKGLYGAPPPITSPAPTSGPGSVTLYGLSESGEIVSQDSLQNHSIVALRVGANSPFILCTGALIANNVVLTARHCVSSGTLNEMEADCYGRPNPSLSIDWAQTPAGWRGTLKGSCAAVPSRILLEGIEY